MDLAQHIEEIRAGVKAGRYVNEASVSQGIVLRLLQALGWPSYDTQIICPEYSLEGRRVDFALCHPATKPIAFIEVKQIGQSDGAERQLFEYAFHVGVPLAILTDGQEWNFFLPAEQGSYGERRVYKLDIVERDVAECVARLNRYINYEAVTSGRAIAAAREDYKDVARNRKVLAALPEAWSKLVAEEDELLLELVAEQVESLCGFKPDLDTVARFLKSVPPTAGTLLHIHPPEPRPHLPYPGPPVDHPQGRVGFSLNGKFSRQRNAKDVLVNVFEALAARDASFLGRFASLPRHGRKRRYLARTPDELYPGRPDLARENSVRVGSGWYLGTNASRQAINRIVKIACEVANIDFGRDLITYLGD